MSIDSGLPTDAEIQQAQKAAAGEIISHYREQIESTPRLLSLLYDIDLMPEQITTRANAVRMAAVCDLAKRVDWMEGLFDFSDDVVLHHAPNDPVTKDAVVVLRSHYEAKK